MEKPWQELKIRNHNNLALAVLFRKPLPGSAAGKGDKLGSPVVVTCHGFTGSKEGGGRSVEMGNNLAQLGFSTLLFDFAGCGQSEGEWSDISLSGQVEDLASVVEWCRAEGFGRIILTGRSFGGSTAICYAARDRSVAAVCTWAAVARPKRLFFPLLAGREAGPAAEPITFERDGISYTLQGSFFTDLEKHDLSACAAAIAPRMLLVIHGSADESVPLEEARLLYASASEPKELFVIEGADHRFSRHIDRVWKVFFSWLQALAAP